MYNFFLGTTKFGGAQGAKKFEEHCLQILPVATGLPAIRATLTWSQTIGSLGFPCIATAKNWVAK